MALMPVVTREMGVLARRQSMYWARSLTAVVAVLTMIWLLLVGAAHSSFASVGTSIFFMLSGFSFAFALVAGMQATSDSVSEEKREGTLGLLFLTDLRAIHIVLGKLAASSLSSVFAVLGVVPMLALALLLGGVTLQQVGLVAIVLLNSMFLSLALGIFVSTLSQNERKAMFACFVGLFLITAGPFIVALTITSFDKMSEEIIWLSPLYSFLSTQGVPAMSQYLLRALLFQHALAWAFLVGASHILPRCVNDLPVRRFLRFREMVDNYIFGQRDERRRYRAELLDRNAFLWLAAREKGKPRYAWAVVAFFALLFLWVGAEFPTMFFDPPVPLTIIFLVHFIFKLWTASEVCSRLIQDRRSGALELLLCSPLGVREIAEGQGLALRRIFRWPLGALISAEVLLMVTVLKQARDDIGRDTVILFLAAISTLLLDLWALKWVGLWLSLFGKSIERVLLATVGRVLGIPTVAFVVIAGTLSTVVALQGAGIPALINYLLAWSISIFFSLCFGLAARYNFLRHFREIATQRFDGSASTSARRAAKQAPRRPSGPWVNSLWKMIRHHWIISGATTSVLALVLIPFCRQLYWKHRLTAQLGQLRLQGQPLNLAQIGHLYPILSPSEDAFAVLQTAGAVNLRKPINGIPSAQWFNRARTNEATIFGDLRVMVAANPVQLRAFHNLDSYDKAYLDPEVSGNWWLPVDVRGYISLGAADTILAAEQHDWEHVQLNLKSLLNIARVLRRQPLLGLQYSCLESLQTFSAALDFILSQHSPNAAELLELQVLVDRVEDPGALGRTLSIERARLLQMWGHADPQFPGQPPAVLSAGHALLSAIGSLDRLLVGTLESFAHVQSLASRSRGELLKDGALLTPTHGQFFNTWSSYNRPDELFSMVHNDIGISARIELLRAVLAAERFHRAHQAFPATLQELVPQYLDHRPIDPFTGEPFETERESNRLVIHAPGQKSGGKGIIETVRLSFELKPPKDANGLEPTPSRP